MFYIFHLFSNILFYQDLIYNQYYIHYINVQLVFKFYNHYLNLILLLYNYHQIIFYYHYIVHIHLVHLLLLKIFNNHLMVQYHMLERNLILLIIQHINFKDQQNIQVKMKMKINIFYIYLLHQNKCIFIMLVHVLMVWFYIDQLLYFLMKNNFEIYLMIIIMIHFKTHNNVYFYMTCM